MPAPAQTIALGCLRVLVLETPESVRVLLPDHCRQCSPDPAPSPAHHRVLGRECQTALILVSWRNLVGRQLKIVAIKHYSSNLHSYMLPRLGLPANGFCPCPSFSLFAASLPCCIFSLTLWISAAVIFLLIPGGVLDPGVLTTMACPGPISSSSRS